MTCLLRVAVRDLAGAEGAGLCPCRVTRAGHHADELADYLPCLALVADIEMYLDRELLQSGLVEPGFDDGGKLYAHSGLKEDALFEVVHLAPGGLFVEVSSAGPHPAG